MKKLNNLAINIGLIFVALITGILAGEIGLRAAKIEGLKKVNNNEPLRPTIFHTYDRYRAWALQPGFTAWWREEGEAYIEINSDGLRDREYSKIKPENTLRIAILGDSFAEAVQVPIEKTFWSIIEQKLTKCDSITDRKVEVINFGVHGYSTLQELLTLRHQVWDYNPDIVLLAFFIGNDIINNSKKLEYSQYRPFLVYENGELVVDMSFQDLTPALSNRYAASFIDKMPGWLVNNFRILQVVKKVDLNLKKKRVDAYLTGLVPYNFQPPINNNWYQAWQITEELITLIVEEVRQRENFFFAVLVGDPKQVHYDQPYLQKTFMKQYNINDMLYPNKRIEILGERLDFPVLDLATPFRDYAVENRVCLHGFENTSLCTGHWNREGHQLAGEIITKNLCRQLKVNYNQS